MLKAASDVSCYSLDIVVNALSCDAAQIEVCLRSLHAHTSGPMRVLVLSSQAEALALDWPAGWTGLWLQIEQPSHALSRVLEHLRAPWCWHLNAALQVTPDWLAELLAVAKRHERVGFVAPWGNRLGAQSLNRPENPELPLDFTPAQMAWRMRRSAPHIHPVLPLLHPDALLMRREVWEAVTLDTTLDTPEQQLLAVQTQARQAGWQARLADGVYVFRAQVESEPLDWPAAQQQQGCLDHRVLESLRSHHQYLLERWHQVELGQYYWNERRVLIILPLRETSGGTHVLVSEASAMRRMGVDVHFLNFHVHRAGWEACYPDLVVPMVYVNGPDEVAAACAGFEAVLATAYFTVDWLVSLKDYPHAPRLGYYVQDFEPYFFLEKVAAQLPGFWRFPALRRRVSGFYFRRHAEFRRAWLSYSVLPEMLLLTKTAWNQRELKAQVGRDSVLIGASYQNDVFLPRDTHDDREFVRITAMIRPSTVRRSPDLTMRVLRHIQHHYGAQVEVCIFGANPDDPAFLALPRDFVFQQHRILPSRHVADVLSGTDIFVDFSQFQAMGLTGLEAMACGAAVILPQNGGTDAFAEHEENALLVNSHCEKACVAALRRLIDEPLLRRRLAARAQEDAMQYSAEAAAFRVLDGFFGHELESFRGA